jgi:D-amino peptidase
VKVFISSDFEGTAGVVEWDQVREGGPRYEYFCELLVGEVNAAIEGAVQAGATEFLVNDSHGKMANLRPGDLAHGASYLSGRYKPMYMMEGLDGSFDAIFFVSYHGSMGSVSTLSHTYFPQAFAEVRLNGAVVGESGINALVAHHFGVPIVLVTGDQVTADEMRAICPSAHSAVVKESVSRFSANSLHPERARDLIRAEACSSLTGLMKGSNARLDESVTLEVSFKSTDHAELASRVEGIRRTGPLSAVISGDPLATYQRFITAVLLSRGLVE